VAALAGVVGHGGVGGAVVETLLVAGIVAIFVAVWLRERRASRAHDRDQIKPQ
jgi:hypothetical protein